LRRDGRPVDDALLQRMCAALEHRGPDSRGVLADGPAGLGIQRLRVIDLETGDQPIRNEDGSVAVVLNGEIYNFRELRAELRRAGHRFATQGDTEVIVHLYEEHGPACVQRLHGMFAFALWDRRRRRLLLARDRAGKKPLYYALRDGALSWASEMAALLQDDEIPREVDAAALDAYLALGYVPAPLSAFRAVRKLPPAHTLTLEAGHVRVQRYWRLDYSRKLDPVDEPELHERIRAAIRAATRRRMIADVPLGAFLSGGIDSSAVVAAMAEASPEPVKTFSIGFDSDAFDELPHARRIAELFGTDHHEFVVRPDAFEVVPRIVRHHGEPFADSSAIPSFYLAEMTRRHVTVALNGDGGDESFAGYTRYVANRLAARLDRVPGAVRRAGAAAGGRLPAGGAVSSPLNRARRLARALALHPARRYAEYVAWFGARERADIYTDAFRAELRGSCPEDAVAAPWAAASGADVVDVMLEVDVLTYLPGDLLPKIDIATMAHALEARSPLLDHEVMELAASIPADLKVRGGQKKWILRQALRGWLPDEILDRPKQGFSVPIGDWLRGELRDHVRDVLLDPGTLERGYFRADAVTGLLDRHDSGHDGEAKRIWALLMLELWHRELVDGGRVGAALAEAA
ncbi:MAG TPA: asparagine synthase (glutamine-hydrolyzing), partial [Solirubrobacteraceae bacterium]|nr:asparagine synthase (glutamine-hydrolyzing) [Solirubrobacteraceae bacterium]